MNERTWYQPRFLRAIYVGIGVVFGFLAVAGFIQFVRVFGEVSAGESVTTAIFVVVCAIPAATFVRAALRSRVTVSDEGVEVVNAWLRWRVTWSEVEYATSSYYGLMISLRDGQVVRAAALQKPNWTRWTNATTESDNVRALINRKVGETPPAPS